jgi:hypothetical protein
MLKGMYTSGAQRRNLPTHLSASLFFVGLAYQGHHIVLRFIIEYSTLRYFGPLGNRSSVIHMRIFEKMIFWLVFKLDIKDFGFFYRLF